jgi:hypothetical protein
MAVRCVQRRQEVRLLSQSYPVSIPLLGEMGELGLE